MSQIVHRRSYTPSESLTLAERRALSWAVKRAADNSCVMFGYAQSNAERDRNEKAYAARVKLARRAMRKVAELWGQGL